MRRFTLAIVFTLFILPQLTHAQSAETSSDTGTIESQFDYLYEVSNNFQEYKVINRNSLDKLKSNVLDSIRGERTLRAELNTQLKAQKDSISSLKGSLQRTEAEKQEAIAAKDNFSFLGMGIHKAVYSSLMWTLVAVLAGAFGFFSFQYSRSFKKIRKAQRDLEEVQEEFDQHRKNTLERERKMKRELIDAQMGKK
ncbi:hypothetical protein [Algoriphagus namhaensis]